jgi:uncharacterized damage-inducible protein DinB
MSEIGTAFIEHSRRYLRSELAPRLRQAVEKLPDEAVWWRPNPASNSIGNLILHLSGNVRQWIVSGVGGAPDTRARQSEFDASGAATASELLEQLENTLRDADAALAALTTAQLTEVRTIQGRKVTVLEAIYHAVEHFSMHTGQILYITKLRLGEDLGFYEVEQGIPWPVWHRP